MVPVGVQEHGKHRVGVYRGVGVFVGELVGVEVAVGVGVSNPVGVGVVIALGVPSSHALKV